MHPKHSKTKFISFTFLVIVLVLLISSLSINKNNMAENIRNPAVAGAFYPGDNKTLSSAIDEFLNKADKDTGLQNKQIKALIVPHAGYVYSGGVAAYGYNIIKDKNIKTVIILAPTHHVYFNGASIGNYTHYKTPLGLIKLSTLAEKLKQESNLINTIDEAHFKEHSLEVQIPFLQKTLECFEIVPIITGDLSQDQIKELAELISQNLDDQTLVVASSDLSHFYPYDKAVEMDNRVINTIESMNMDKAKEQEMCGKTPILILMNIAKSLNWDAKILKYANSGDVTGDKSSVVGYTSIAFYQNNSENKEDSFLSNAQKKELLTIARKTLEDYIKEGNKYNPKTDDEELKEAKGVFVTLEKNSQLRGCIGNILPDKPIYIAVRDNAINAAVNDPRFEKVTADELDNIKIEISVLSVPDEIKADNSKEKIDKIKENIDGIILSKGWSQATFLPQVWEQLLTKDEFLSQLCLKAGLSADCYLEEGIKIEKYQALHFSE